MKVALSHQRRHQFIQALKDQPESYFMGTNWAGITYAMSSEDHAHRAKILSVLKNPPRPPSGSCKPIISLPKRSWEYIYAVIAQKQLYYRDCQGPWFFTTHTRESQLYNRMKKFFLTETGIKKPPANAAWTK